MTTHIGRGRDRLANERGSMLLFTTGLLGLFLVMGGAAVDLAYLAAASGEMQRSVDAAALAGAGKLGFDATVFSTVRATAQTYAAANPYRDLAQAGAYSNVALGLNTGNATTGSIVLGLWDPAKPAGIGAGRRFEPSLDGTRVNAVLCQYQATVPPTFLRLIGQTSLGAAVQAIAVSNPPSGLPASAPLFPIGVSPCSFANNSSAGCGGQLSIQFAPTPNNNGAWVNIHGTGTPNAAQTRNDITAVANGTPAGSTLTVDSMVGTDNGEEQSAFDTLADDFVTKFNASAGHPIIIKDSSGNVAYSGQGWLVYVPVIATTCPPGPVNNTDNIVGWTQFVITQVFDKNRGVRQGGAARGCMVVNHNPAVNIWDADCTNAPPQTATIYGIFDCAPIQGQSLATPGPRTALATRIKLVN
ncbi:MAG: hypothetical protein HY294_15810 [Candidatus Rokubacteria bacterium]|nr:hypothetical protein [Candidatus Rokubacteria bacterium]